MTTGTGSIPRTEPLNPGEKIHSFIEKDSGHQMLMKQLQHGSSDLPHASKGSPSGEPRDSPVFVLL